MAQQIRNGYIDYVLTNDDKPKSVYSFAKKLKISEEEFYNFYASFESIENGIWKELTAETIVTLQQQETWNGYSSRDKVLAFFYSYVEVLKKHRSFVVYSLGQTKHIGIPAGLSAVKPLFEQFAVDVINEGLETGELADRKFLSKRYKDALWVQFTFIVRFWVNDNSDGFEKTDEAIERGINVAFDLFERSALDNLLEYGKFLSRNGRFREKMGI